MTIKYKKDLSPRIKKLLGVTKLPKKFDYKKALEAALKKMYIK